MGTQVRHLLGMGRFLAVELAHKLRWDYERGVFSRQTLVVIEFSVIAAVIGTTQSEWSLSATTTVTAGLFTYTAAQADRRWRDSWGADPLGSGVDSRDTRRTSSWDCCSRSSAPGYGNSRRFCSQSNSTCSLSRSRFPACSRSRCRSGTASLSCGRHSYCTTQGPIFRQQFAGFERPPLPS